MLCGQVALVDGRVAAVRLGPGARDRRRGAASPSARLCCRSATSLGADARRAARPRPRRRTAGRSARATPRRDRRRAAKRSAAAKPASPITSAPVVPRRGVQHLVVRHLAEARRQARARGTAAAAASPSCARRRRARSPSSPSQGTSPTSSTVRTGPKPAMAMPGTMRSSPGAGARSGASGSGQVDLAALEQLGAARRQLERQLEAVVAQARARGRR